MGQDAASRTGTNDYIVIHGELAFFVENFYGHCTQIGIPPVIDAYNLVGNVQYKDTIQTYHEKIFLNGHLSSELSLFFSGSPHFFSYTVLSVPHFEKVIPHSYEKEKYHEIE